VIILALLLLGRFVTPFNALTRFSKAYLAYREKASFSETIRFEAFLAEKLLKTVRFKMLRNALKRLATLVHGVEKVF